MSISEGLCQAPIANFQGQATSRWNSHSIDPVVLADRQGAVQVFPFQKQIPGVGYGEGVVEGQIDEIPGNRISGAVSGERWR